VRTRTDSGSLVKFCGLTRTQKFQDPHISATHLAILKNGAAVWRVRKQLNTTFFTRDST